MCVHTLQCTKYIHQAGFLLFTFFSRNFYLCRNKIQRKMLHITEEWPPTFTFDAQILNWRFVTTTTLKLFIIFQYYLLDNHNISAQVTKRLTTDTAVTSTFSYFERMWYIFIISNMSKSYNLLKNNEKMSNPNYWSCYLKICWTIFFCCKTSRP